MGGTHLVAEPLLTLSFENAFAGDDGGWKGVDAHSCSLRSLPTALFMHTWGVAGMSRFPSAELPGAMLAVMLLMWRTPQNVQDGHLVSNGMCQGHRIWRRFLRGRTCPSAWVKKHD